MKTLLIFVSALLASLAQAGDLPWIGVSFKSPSAKDRESTSLKSGVGFRASEIVANGPLAKAGGKNGDLWWKFDGQILVNMEQMVVLLREKKAGDTVKVQFFREGQLKTLDLVLGSRHRPLVMPVSMLAGDENAARSRRLAKREQIARLIMDEKSLSLEAEGERWRFKVTEDDVVVLSALVSNDDFGGKLPRKWMGAFMILKQTLQRSREAGNPTPGERVRFVPKDS
ncbi:S1C family serine protease [Akkermansiaceae bacterium]|nr:S1C family serine protease [Akkermansiaceae bacterium]MDA7868320.1 S1C family serine protease [bacterium]MDA7867529.1 S1C family serine protease [Akkermansiaceae bacterium]MDA7892432.1 S1C family serine protease [Akkermansiaceae bacterium]MDA7907584.1 S1C family serine protease [Akkermansiaceae bacterium]